MSSNREFHTAGLETRKLLEPNRRVLVRGVVRCPYAAERRWALALISEIEMQDRLRYVGPRPWFEFRTKVAILKMMRWWMGSQWSWSLSTGVMWSNFLVFVISLATAWERIATFARQRLWQLPIPRTIETRFWWPDVLPVNELRLGKKSWNMASGNLFSSSWILLPYRIFEVMNCFGGYSTRGVISTFSWGAKFFSFFQCHRTIEKLQENSTLYVAI